MDHNPLEALGLHDTTRAGFLARAALGLGGLTTVAGLRPAAALAQSDGDAGVLNLALALEYVQVAFYERGVEVVDGEERKLATEFLGHQKEHVEALRGLIEQVGGKAADAPRTRIQIADASAFLKTAVALEDAAVQAYDGAATELSDLKILAAAGQIAQVEARHSAAWRVVSDLPPSPSAFEPALSATKARAALKPFLQPS